jgi:glycosyltransferase involved in cell wall biosynthesis
MIVRNEAANIERCLASVVDHVGCWIVGDTGSADDTPARVQSFFGSRNMPGELHRFPFDNFEQARNEALGRARASALEFDYLLLTDADMELRVRAADFRDRLTADSYRVLQNTGSLSYWNTRLLRRDVTACYRGATHEYLDVKGQIQPLTDIWFFDHASGANRVDKYTRDIGLLQREIEHDPDNVRSWFYLANSFRDAGRDAEAAQAYANRIGMGGWDEEVWAARWQRARCLQRLGDEAAFVHEALAAFDSRPWRIEPLYDVVRHYRMKGRNEIAAVLCEPLLTAPRPTDDLLFVEDRVYETGLLEEYSIVAYHTRDADRIERGRASCDLLAFGRGVNEEARQLARRNSFFYARPLQKLLPSFEPREMLFRAPAPFRPTNPSILRWEDGFRMIQRCVNYRLVEGRYLTPDKAPVTTRNFLVELDAELRMVGDGREILGPADWPVPRFGQVLGFEDCRLLARGNELWCSATVRELTDEGWCEIVLARIDIQGEECRLSDWCVLRPEGERRTEKNWMPLIGSAQPRFIRSLDPTHIVDAQAHTLSTLTPGLAVDHLRGGSQAVSFDGGWLAIAHDVALIDDRRHYAHRFVWLDAEHRLRAISPGFRFFGVEPVEYAAGLAWHPDGERLIVSFGVADRESWLGSFRAEELRAVLRG